MLALVENIDSWLTDLIGLQVSKHEALVHLGDDADELPSGPHDPSAPPTAAAAAAAASRQLDQVCS